MNNYQPADAVLIDGALFFFGCEPKPRKRRKSTGRQFAAPTPSLEKCGAKNHNPQTESTVPDVRDGLTRRERIIFYVLDDTQRE